MRIHISLILIFSSSLFFRCHKKESDDCFYPNSAPGIRIEITDSIGRYNQKQYDQLTIKHTASDSIYFESEDSSILIYLYYKKQMIVGTDSLIIENNLSNDTISFDFKKSSLSNCFVVYHFENIMFLNGDSISTKTSGYERTFQLFK